MTTKRSPSQHCAGMREQCAILQPWASDSRVVLKVVKAVMLQVLLASPLSMKRRVTSSLAVVSAGTDPNGKEPLKLETKTVSADGWGAGMSGFSSALLASTPPSEKVST